MINFKNFITEAKVSKQNLNKVADIFKRIIEKKLSVKLFRFAGPRGFTEIKNGMGILYIYSDHRAIRLNYVKGEIVSLTLWKKFRINTPGDYTIDLSGLGLLEAGKKLIELIQRPKTGKVLMYPELMEDAFLTEAKRVSPEDFMEIIQRNLPGNMSVTSVPRSVMVDIAAANEILIPSIVNTTSKIPGTKGKNLKYDLTKAVNATADSGKPSRDNEPVYYLKITAQDRDTKKFMSVKGDKKAEQYLKAAAGAIETPDYKTEMQDPDTMFGHMSNLVSIVCRGSRNSLVIYGGAGIGKSFVVTKTIQEEGLQKNKDWFLVKGKITTASLYQTLFMHRKGSLLVFDDTDSVWGDAEAANILKAALDSYEERTISWVSPRNVNVSLMNDDEKEEYNSKIDDMLLTDPGNPKIKLPTEFAYEGKIIFISNLKEEKFDAAVLNRSAKIDMSLTPDQVFMRMKSILQHMGDPAVPMNVKEDILKFLRDQSDKNLLTGVSMRTFVAAEDLYRSGVDNWKDLLRYV